MSAPNIVQDLADTLSSHSSETGEEKPFPDSFSDSLITDHPLFISSEAGLLQDEIRQRVFRELLRRKERSDLFSEEIEKRFKRILTPEFVARKRDFQTFIRKATAKICGLKPQRIKSDDMDMLEAIDGLFEEPNKE